MPQHAAAANHSVLRGMKHLSGLKCVSRYHLWNPLIARHDPNLHTHRPTELDVSFGFRAVPRRQKPKTEQKMSKSGPKI